VALGNGRPTLVEFYADWCEACRSMAPAVEAIEADHRGRLDVVLLNVDNPRWQPELERYGVNGIPHLEFFDTGGRPIGQAIGTHSAPELRQLVDAVLSGSPLPDLAGVGAVSRLSSEAGRPLADPATMAAPRSHG
jgi:thiol:disulfide interchange protein